MIAPIAIVAISVAVALALGFGALRFAVDVALVALAAVAVLFLERFLGKSWLFEDLLKEPYIALFLCVPFGLAAGEFLLGYRERFVAYSWKDGLFLTLAGAAAVGGLLLVMIGTFAQEGFAGKSSRIFAVLAVLAPCCTGVAAYAVLMRFFPN
jgi:hypothetical protein